jgi:hypothetical protein
MSEPPPQKSRMSRTSRFILFGCLALTIGFFCFTGLFIYGVIYVMKSSDAFQISLKQVQSDTKVQSVLGTPVRDGWFVLGNVEVNPESGNADIGYSISGPKGSGVVHVKATKLLGKWTIDHLVVTPDGQQKDLILVPVESAPLPFPDSDSSKVQPEGNSEKQ